MAVLVGYSVAGLRIVVVVHSRRMWVVRRETRDEIREIVVVVHSRRMWVVCQFVSGV